MVGESMTTTVEFAPGYAKDTEHPNYIILPRDVEWRRSLYPQGVFQHPAKMQLHIVKLCVEYLEARGDISKGMTVLDPFGGTGSTALAATMGYPVVLIELEEKFQALIRELKQKWRDGGIESAGIAMLTGDSRQLLPQLGEGSIDIVLTSPPYANLAVGRVKTEFTGDLAIKKEQMRQYGSDAAHPLNFGRLNTFEFNQHMRGVYKEIFRVLKPGGFYISVTKDQMRAGDKNMLGADVVRSVTATGLVLDSWFKWKPPGSMLKRVMESKGAELVESEDIVLFRKGQ